MNYDEIVRSKEGKQTRIQRVDEIEIPDLWHLAMAMQNKIEGAGRLKLENGDVDEILETWHLCHDLLKHIHRICAERDSHVASSTPESGAA
jgi:hypothetical protein